MTSPRRCLSLLVISMLSMLSARVLFARGEQGEDVRALIRALRAHRGSHGEVQRIGGKCGLQNYVGILDSWNHLDQSQRNEVRTILSPFALQKDRIIGRFRFEYDTTGSNAPTLLDADYNQVPGTAEAFVDSAGKYFNVAYDFEITRLGFEAPPLADDGTYHVTIRDLGYGLYGETIPDPDPFVPGSPPRYRSTIEIDNDFKDLPWTSSRGMPGLEVTSAHEFHHCVQLGSYGFWGSGDLYFYEITSTWMEDVVHNDINDYYQYLSNDASRSSQFSHPELRFTRSDDNIQYSRAVWGKFLEKRYTRNMMRRTWEFMRQYSSVPALDHALAEAGSSFREAFQEFAYWNLNTGPASDTGRFYSEGQNYPTMRIGARIDYLPPVRSYGDAIQALSSTYYQICLLTTPSDSCSVERQMPVIITNFNSGSEYSDATLAYSYKLSATNFEGAEQLTNGIFAGMEVSDPQNWNALEAVPSAISDVLPFPNPYRVHERVPIWFRFPMKPQSASVAVNIFSSSFDRIFSGEVPVIEFNPLEFAAKWDGHADNGESIATGIYLFVIDVDGHQYIGKFAAVKE